MDGQTVETVVQQLIKMVPVVVDAQP